MTDLDERLDRAADDLWAVVPLGASARQVAPRRSVHVVVLGLAAVTLLVALGAVWVWRAAPATEPVSDLPGPSTPAPTSTIPGTTVPGSTPPTTVVEPTSSWPPAGTVLQTEVEYVIREGDYPTTVASLWQVPFDVLMTLNGWTLQDAGIVPEWPGVGATILIPAGATVPDLPTARSVDVAEQQMHVTLTSDLTCDQPFREPTDGVDSFVLELFSDREARRWLMRATVRSCTAGLMVCNRQPMAVQNAWRRSRRWGLVDSMGVKMQVAPSKREAWAAAKPVRSEPAMG